MRGGPFEPTADARQWARFLRDLHNALVAEGFTPDQAIALLGHLIGSSRGTS